MAFFAFIYSKKEYFWRVKDYSPVDGWLYKY